MDLIWGDEVGSGGLEFDAFINQGACRDESNGKLTYTRMVRRRTPPPPSSLRAPPPIARACVRPRFLPPTPCRGCRNPSKVTLTEYDRGRQESMVLLNGIHKDNAATCLQFEITNMEGTV